MQYAFDDHFGLRLSAFDVLAPLSEMALRDISLEYRDPAWLVAAIVHPRAGFWIAVPEVSRHLSLSFVVGYRLIAPETLSSEEDVVRYRPGLNGDHVEIGLAVEYTL